MTNHKPLQALHLLLTRNNPHYTIIYTCVYTEKKITTREIQGGHIHVATMPDTDV